MALSEQWIFRVKAAQRNLIAANGGIEAAASLISVSKTQVGRWNSMTDTDLMPLAAIMQLESSCGAPLVTKAMASLNGHFLQQGEGEGGDEPFLAQQAETLGLAAELMAEASKAMADGKITPSEVAVIDKSASVLERAIGEYRKALSSLHGEGGGKITAIKRAVPPKPRR